MGSPQPHRRVRVTLTIGADDGDELAQVLRDLASRVDTHEVFQTNSHGASGGWGSGYSYEVVIDPEMTGDRYRELLSDWIKAERASDMGDSEP